MINFPQNKFGLTFQPLESADATFVLDLRTDVRLAKHLSPTDNDIIKQESWIRNYKEREKQAKEYYFIYHNSSGEKLGVNRLYNFTEQGFELGSWLFKRGIETSAPILADIIARDFGYEVLGFTFCEFEVRKENKNVVKYHLKYNPILMSHDDFNFYFKLSHNEYVKHRNKLLKILGHGD